MADRPAVRLLQADTPQWKLWSLVGDLSRHLTTDKWVLVGGQMVALHLHLAGAAPLRTTKDVDIVADVLADRSSYAACKRAASELGLTLESSITGKVAHRFVGARGQLDLMVPDHLPARLLRQFTNPKPVGIQGGQRAVDRRIVVDIETSVGASSVPVPDLAGAVVLKARASVADTRDRERHRLDIAQLCSVIDDPINFSAQLDTKEKRYLRKARMSGVTSDVPWLELDQDVRRRALGAWMTLTA